jgi:quinol monooxygenase YgiN
MEGGKGMIVQLVRASIKPEKRNRWLEVMRRNATQTRAEEGCEGYQIAEDLETPNTFVIVELWTNMDAVHNHFRAQFEELMAALGDVFAAPPQAAIHEVASTLNLGQVLAAAGVASNRFGAA